METFWYRLTQVHLDRERRVITSAEMYTLELQKRSFCLDVCANSVRLFSSAKYCMFRYRSVVANAFHLLLAVHVRRLYVLNQSINQGFFTKLNRNRPVFRSFHWSTEQNKYYMRRHVWGVHRLHVWYTYSQTSFSFVQQDKISMLTTRAVASPGFCVRGAGHRFGVVKRSKINVCRTTPGNTLYTPVYALLH